MSGLFIALCSTQDPDQALTNGYLNYRNIHLYLSSGFFKLVNILKYNNFKRAFIMLNKYCLRLLMSQSLIRTGNRYPQELACVSLATH